MYNKKKLEVNKPIIFSKRIKDVFKTIALNKVNNTLGSMRYFPPACQEWSNSIYTYNSTTIKTLSIAQKNLTKLIKSYFSFYFSNNLLHSKRIITRFRRLAVSKILFSKAELKHTNAKVIITLYVYNEEKRILINKLKRIEAIIFSFISSASMEVNKENTSLLSLRKKLELIIGNDAFSLTDKLENIKSSLIEEIKLEKESLLIVNDLNLRKEKLLVIKSLEENLSKVLVVMSSSINNAASHKYYENIYHKSLSKNFLEKEIAIIGYYKLLIDLNKYKFEDLFLSRLRPFLHKIYNKEVEFNIVNLKALYLNSDIFTQAIALKLRNRDNRLLKVLRSFLYMVKLSKINPVKERFAYINIKNLWINRVKDLTINSLGFNIKRDSINDLLTSIFKVSNFSKKLYTGSSKSTFNSINDNGIVSSVSLLNNVLLLLKHKSIAGVRLEAKGRLTRRFTASRSVFKIKWKGSLKNIDSSYRGLSSVILRGHLKSNVLYSVINSKTRNGAFGLKGWISGK